MYPNPIVREPKNKDGSPMESEHYKIMRRTDGKLILFMKNAPLGEATKGLFNGTHKANQVMKDLEKVITKSLRKKRKL